MPGYYLSFTCFKCAQNGYMSSYICKNVDMDGVMKQKCPKCGETIVIRNQTVQFQIYLQCAIEQFSQDNYAETVFLLAKSRESFFEFIIGLLLYENGYKENIDNPLNSFGVKPSERRLGFFLALYFSRFNEVINSDKEIEAKLRNDIMHSQKYPTREEVIKFGNNVLDLFYRVIKKIKSCIDISVIYEYIFALQDKKLKLYFKEFGDCEICLQNCSDAIDWFAREIDVTENFEQLCCIIARNNDGLFAHSIRL